MDYSAGELLLGLRYFRNDELIVGDAVEVNYCLIYRTSETGAIAAGTLIAGELLLGLRYIRN